MSIKIITDSASDINNNEFANVVVLPLTVSIEGVTYRDGVDLTKDEFYKKLQESESLPVSSLISPFVFENAFERIKADGDEAIVITLSSGLSGTYQSAIIPAKNFDCVSVIDSRCVSAAERLLVLRAMELIAEGKTREEIVEILEEEKNKILIFAVVDTTKYLQKGGRISKGASFFANALNIKPVITLEDGKLVAIGKALGAKKGNQFLENKIAEVGGIDFTKPYAVGYAGTDKTHLLNYIESSKYLLPDDGKDIEIVQIGSAVGTHSGPGAISVTFFKK